MKLYGLLGRNISYSLSPSMHNAAFKAMGIEAEYRLFDIPQGELESFFGRMRKEEIAGANVTIPYKEHALNFVDKCDNLTKDIGAINTIAVKDGRLSGYNTDYEGFIEAVKGKGEGNLNFSPAGKSVFVFGAGGAAKAVVFGLLNLGAKKIAIADVDTQKAEELASSIVNKHKGNFLITVVKDETKYEEFISMTDLLVNATPCGAKKNDPPLFDYRYMNERLFIFDLIYATETPLLKEARRNCARAAGGLNMLLYQAAASFAIWTGKRAPIEVMRKAALGRLR